MSLLQPDVTYTPRFRWMFHWLPRWHWLTRQRWYWKRAETIKAARTEDA